MTTPQRWSSATPRYEWRGMHLDTSRHRFVVPVLLRWLERLAFFGFNRFHWHLTDDQGWRLPSRTWPRLATVGAWRTHDHGQRYGGAYAREEIATVVARAGELGITVVPEVDLPGHTQSVLAAYPQLGCRQETVPVWNQWGVSEHVLCAGREATYDFVRDILCEVAEMFPGPYIHIGGDECPKTHWQACPACQQRMRDESLDSERALQRYFTGRVCEMVRSLGKTPIGWDETLDNGPVEGLIVTAWHGDGREAVARAAQCDTPAILCPQQPCYFDWRQSDRPGEVGAFGVTTARDVFLWQPAAGLPPGATVLGAQGNVWSERIATEATLTYMTMPRMAALASVLHGDPPDWEEFMRRARQLRRHPLFKADPPWGPLEDS